MANEPKPESNRNDLETFLAWRLPELWEKHGNRILIGLTLVALLVLAIQWRGRVTRNAELENTRALGDLWGSVNQLERNASSNGTQAKELRLRSIAEIESAADQLAKTGVKSQEGLAMLARGEAYWIMANLPAPAATTQPATSPAGRSPREFLDAAQSTYETLLQDYSDNPELVASALQSLAAIAENKGDFDGAKRRYQQLIDETNQPEAAKAMATQLRDSLSTLTTQPYLAAPLAPTSLPSLLAAPATQP